MDTRGKELYNKLVEKIDKLEPFKFIRWGDGDLRIYFETGRGSNEYDYDRFGAKNLKKCMDGDFYYGIQNYAKEKFKNELPDREWVNADIFHYASIDGRLRPLFGALKGKDIVIVGPKFLKDIEIIKYNHFIEVPERNCFKAL